MRVGFRRRVCAAPTVALALAILLWGARAPAAAAPAPEADDAGPVHTVVTADGEPVLTTGLRVHPGDGFIDPADNLWVISSVEGTRAIARLSARLTQGPTPEQRRLIARTVQPPVLRSDLGAEDRHDVVLYHTHSGESYRPTDGVESNPGRGSIYTVGEALNAALQEQGLRVVHRQENHNPHDHGAYGRSRRTAVRSLLEHAPAAVFDIHRDGAPASEYAFTWQGTPAARVMIVVGRSNPGHEANLTFARLLKAKADELTPGLLRGIYLGQGNYNQDTLARNLLLEAGTVGTPREEAERGIALFAAAVPPVLLEAGLTGSRTAEAEEGTAARSIGGILAAAVALGAGWLVLVCGGVRPALAKLADWRRELWDRR